MALQDFIQALQEQDVVYSTPPQPSIRVIPPENQCIKIIPPESAVLDPAPKVIKLKIKQKPVEQTPVQSTVQPQPQVQKPILQPVNREPEKPKLQPVSRPVEQPQVQQVVQQPVQTAPQPQVVQQPVQQTQQKPQAVIPKYTPPDDDEISSVLQSDVPQEPKELTDDDIFNSTGTEYSKKTLWMEYFEKAKNSRKSNPIVDRMKVGRFTITPDNKVLLLPDYDIVGKDPDDVLKDKWF